jgi:hypothetical protein
MQHMLVRGSVSAPYDATYTSDITEFEMVRLGLAEDQPVCVQQWSGLVSFEATRTMGRLR